MEADVKAQLKEMILIWLGSPPNYLGKFILHSFHPLNRGRGKEFMVVLRAYQRLDIKIGDTIYLEPYCRFGPGHKDGEEPEYWEARYKYRALLDKRVKTATTSYHVYIIGVPAKEILEAYIKHKKW